MVGMLKVGGMQIQAQRRARDERAGPQQRRGQDAAQPPGARQRDRRAEQGALGFRGDARTVGMGTVGPRAGGVGAVQAEQRRPPVKALAERAPQRRGIGVAGRDKAARLDPGELHQAPAGVHRAPRLVRVEPQELAFVVGIERAQRPVGAAPASPGAQVLEAVLGDRVAAALALDQPTHHLRRALRQRVQIARRDHQQRHVIDAMVVQPVADQRAALERCRLDVVQGHGDRAARRTHGRAFGYRVRLVLMRSGVVW